MYLKGNKLKILLPYLGTLLILCGYLKLAFFYSHFGIKISDYLEITEVITLFLSDAFKYAMIIFGVFLFGFITDSSDEIEDKENLKNEIMETEKWFPRLIKFLKFSTASIVNLSIYLVFTVIAYFFNPKNIYLLIIFDCMITLIIIFSYFMLEYKRKYKLRFGENFDSTYNNLILMFFIFLLSVFYSVYLEIKITEKKNQQFVCFTYLKKDYQSEKEYLYLGQTKNYLFMYDKANDETNVFTRKDITNFVMKTK